MNGVMAKATGRGQCSGMTPGRHASPHESKDRPSLIRLNMCLVPGVIPNSNASGRVTHRTSPVSSSPGAGTPLAIRASNTVATHATSSPFGYTLWKSG